MNIIKICPPLHITQHKRFVPFGTHPNLSLTLRTSFILETLGDISIQRKYGDLIYGDEKTYI
jgi:hypothetical protein